jgi:hypothetical protein
MDENQVVEDQPVEEVTNASVSSFTLTAADGATPSQIANATAAALAYPDEPGVGYSYPYPEQ